MKPGQKTCILDAERDTLTCKEADGSDKMYDMSNISLLSKESRDIKESKMREIINVGKRCFDSGKCTSPVNVTVFQLESCPACKAHAAMIGNVRALVSIAKIPVTFTTKDARKHIDEFKALGCNGAPCVAMSVGNGETKKIYDGTRGEIGILSDMFGIPNPLYYKVDLKTEKPRRLMS
jgi:hypothetical protein